MSRLGRAWRKVYFISTMKGSKISRCLGLTRRLRIALSSSSLNISVGSVMLAVQNESQAMKLIESDPSLIKRVLVGAEGKPLYSKIRGSNVREGTPDFFSTNDALSAAIVEGRAIVMAEPQARTALLLFASPIGQTPLRLDQEARDLAEKLRQVKDPKVLINIAQHWAVRSGSNPRLHFQREAAHPALQRTWGRRRVVLQDTAGHAAPVTAKAFGELTKLASGHVECVVMTLCFSQDLARAAAAHVKAVIGCDSTIGDKAAIAFARSFYRALANGEDYKKAFDWAVNDVRLATSDAEAGKYKFSKKKRS